ncbi:MAG: exodeoxyribonuclease VII large subunit [Lachnospiraceae bacterium]|uniref:exodeoxyribonuclease VII large subunit n=1 Tax=uncultured Acetatifactor sp. TaxID=1671927 RepID=UPI00260C4F82|nr:exodeoxyribonuclease VII large subunit [uncultured Acetatifactor sp.]MCI8787796.1 exodeoxyribonuclease VII large subunit [Lachnospiraceae bacterium]
MEIRNVVTVGQLNSYIKNMFTQDYLLQRIFVKGEVSNCKYHSSGHIYFTLKDSRGTISCVMFAGSRSGLSFRMSEGQQVIVGGTVDVYERDGKYQLYAKQIMLDGSGQLYERFEMLKRELEESGMFAREYKQPIPRFIRTLGVVTADTGAAVRDIIQVAGRRNPYVQIILYPAIVQGEAAVGSIVRGIRALEALGVDVMIVGRGGGSIEDLWAFNEREVAQAVFDCSVPVISAVGHETDTTIIDFVSDLRAPTPSAAAELAVTDIREVLGELEGRKDALARLMQRRIQEKRMKARQMELKLKAASPASRIRERKMAALSAEERLQERMRRILDRRRHELAIYIERMKGLSPLEKLSSGYSYVEDQAGRNVRSVRQVREGQDITIRVKDGRIQARTTGILPLPGRPGELC